MGKLILQKIFSLFCALLFFIIAASIYDILHGISGHHDDSFIIIAGIPGLIGVIFLLSAIFSKIEKEAFYGHDRAGLCDNLFSGIDKEVVHKLWNIWWEALPDKGKVKYDRGYMHKKKRFFFQPANEDEREYEKLEALFQKFARENEGKVLGTVLKETAGAFLLGMGIAAGSLGLLFAGAKMANGKNVNPINLIIAGIGLDITTTTTDLVSVTDLTSTITNVDDLTNVANATDVITTENIVKENLLPHFIHIGEYSIDSNSGNIYDNAFNTVGHVIQDPNGRISVYDENRVLVSTCTDNILYDGQHNKIATVEHDAQGSTVIKNRANASITIEKTIEDSYIISEKVVTNADVAPVMRFDSQSGILYDRNGQELIHLVDNNLVTTNGRIIASYDSDTNLFYDEFKQPINIKIDGSTFQHVKDIHGDGIEIINGEIFDAKTHEKIGTINKIEKV